jgi:hypothetical protein
MSFILNLFGGGSNSGGGSAGAGDKINRANSADLSSSASAHLSSSLPLNHGITKEPTLIFGNNLTTTAVRGPTGPVADAAATLQRHRRTTDALINKCKTRLQITLNELNQRRSSYRHGIIEVYKRGYADVAPFFAEFAVAWCRAAQLQVLCEIAQVEELSRRLEVVDAIIARLKAPAPALAAVGAGGASALPTAASDDDLKTVRALAFDPSFQDPLRPFHDSPQVQRLVARRQLYREAANEARAKCGNLLERVFPGLTWSPITGSPLGPGGVDPILSAGTAGPMLVPQQPLNVSSGSSSASVISGTGAGGGSSANNNGGAASARSRAGTITGNATSSSNSAASSIVVTAGVRASPSHLNFLRQRLRQLLLEESDGIIQWESITATIYHSLGSSSARVLPAALRVAEEEEHAAAVVAASSRSRAAATTTTAVIDDAPKIAAQQPQAQSSPQLQGASGNNKEVTAGQAQPSSSTLQSSPPVVATLAGGGSPPLASSSSSAPSSSLPASASVSIPPSPALGGAAIMMMTTGAVKPQQQQEQELQQQQQPHALLPPLLQLPPGTSTASTGSKSSSFPSIHINAPTPLYPSGPNALPPHNYHHKRTYAFLPSLAHPSSRFIHLLFALGQTNYLLHGSGLRWSEFARPIQPPQQQHHQTLTAVGQQRPSLEIPPSLAVLFSIYTCGSALPVPTAVDLLLHSCWYAAEKRALNRLGACEGALKRALNERLKNEGGLKAAYQRRPEGSPWSLCGRPPTAATYE